MESERDEMESAELLKRLRDAIACQPEPVPGGFKTSAQWAKKWGMTTNGAGIVLQRSVKAGVMEMKKFRVPTEGRGNYPTPHYREIKTSKRGDTRTSKPA
jgi:hypothetical protein